jgi:hypothetical protein
LGSALAPAIRYIISVLDEGFPAPQINFQELDIKTIMKKISALNSKENQGMCYFNSTPGYFNSANLTHRGTFNNLAPPY